MERARRTRRAVAYAIAGAAFGAAAYAAYRRLANDWMTMVRDDDDDEKGVDDARADARDECARDENAREVSSRRGGDASSRETSRVETRVDERVVAGSSDGEAARRNAAAMAEAPTPIDVKRTENAGAVYDSLEFAFAEAGLDPTALTPRKFYHFGTYPEVGVWPLRYKDLKMPEDCARLVVLTMEDAPAIASAVQSAVRELVRLVGGVMDTFVAPRGNLHLTVFHVSRTFEYKDAPVACAVDDATGRGTQTLPRATDVEDAIAYEESAVADALHGLGACELEVDRLCLAPSGCLLLCFADVRGHLQTMRERLRDKTVGAARKQNNTMHVTLARMWPKSESRALDDETKRAINAMCAKATSALRGARLSAQNAVYVVEERFGLVDGRRARIKL